MGYPAFLLRCIRLGLLVTAIVGAAVESARTQITLVQTVTGTTNPGTSVQATFSATPTQGNLLVAIVGNRDASSAPTTPSGWSYAIRETNNNPGQAIYYKIAGASESATVTVSGYSSTRLILQLYEYSDISPTSPLNQVNSASGKSSTFSSGSITTTQAYELILVGGTMADNTSVSAWTNSFTERNDLGFGVGNGAITSFGADRIVSSTGTYSTTASVAKPNVDYRGQIVSFKGIITKTWDGGAGTSNWGDANNWNPNGVPTSLEHVSLTGANTINVNVAGVCRNLTLNNASLVLTVKSGFSLTVSGSLTLTSGTLNTEASFPSVSGTTTLSGGTVGYTASSGSQTVTALSYPSLTISGSGTKTLGGNSTVSGNLTVSAGMFDLSTYTCDRTASGGTITVSNGATLRIGGTNTYPANYSTSALGSSSTVDYAGSNETVANRSYGNLTLSGSGTKTMPGTSMTLAGSLTLSGTCTATLAANVSVAGNLSIGAGTTLALSSFTCNRASAGGTLTVSTGGTLTIGGTNSIPSNYSTHSIGSTSTINYNGTNQTVATLNSSQQYGHLTISGSGTKTLGGSLTVRGMLSVSGATLADGGYTLSANGNISNSSSHTGAGKIMLTGGAAAHTLSGTGTYTNLQINDAYGATLSASITVNGTLTLTSGNISTGANTLIMGSSAAVSRTSGHVVGNFRKYVTTGATSRTYEVGDANYYTPVTVSFGNVSVAGNLTAKTTAGEHPNNGLSPVDPAKNASRYWTLTNSGITYNSYSVTFTFHANDLDAGAVADSFIVGRFESSTWTRPTVGTRTSTTTQATGVTGFGDFQVGEVNTTSTVASGASVSSLTWAQTVTNVYNRILIVGVETEHSASLHPSSVTYNGVSLTQISSVSAGTTTYANVSLWYLLNPSAGTANVVVTWSGSVNYATAGAFMIHGRAQVPPEATATGFNNSGTTTTNITTLSDDSYVVDMFGSGQDQGDLAPGGGQTQLFINAAGSTTSGGASLKAVSNAGSTSMTWTQTGINRSAHVVAAFAPAIFYSKGSLAVNTAGNWNTRRNGAGVDAQSFSDGSDWFIQNTHTMSLSGSSSWNLGAAAELTVEAGGAWTNSSSGTVTVGSFTIENGSTYTHSTSNGIPGSSKNIGETSTINYSLSGDQTIDNLPYGHLTISGGGTKSLASNLSIEGNLTVSAATLSLGSYTADRSEPGGTLTVANGATLKIGGTNSFPINYTTISLGATSTTEYNGAGQTVAVQPYGHLILSNGDTKIAADALTLFGDLTIGTGTTFVAGDVAHVVQGNWSNSGTFDARGGTIALTGGANTSISGSSTFNTLVVNKSAGSNTVTLNNNTTAHTLEMTQGKLMTGANTITVTSARTGNGYVIGTITRSQTLSTGVAYAFEGPYQTLTFEEGETLPTSVTVTTTLSSPGANDSMEPVDRYYDISQVGGSEFTYTLRLHYEDSEVSSPNSETSPPLKIWRRTATGPDVWTREGAASSNTTDNWVEQTGLTNTGRYSLSSRTIANMVLDLNASAANPSPGDIITYTIAFTNDGDGSSTNTLVTALAPANTTYVPASTRINGILKTDSPDADEVTVSGSTITVNLGTVGVSGSGTITYNVVIN